MGKPIAAAGTPPHFDAIIVGSGFGGSVTAYRLAEAGLRVCLLERGKAYPPGSFPRTPDRVKRSFWDPSRGLFGLYNIWSFRVFGSIVSSGLGGGSLIYANALLRKDEAWFTRELPGGGYEHWPVTRADLDPHYDAVEKMLGATRYPLEHEPYRSTPKTRAMIEAAEKLQRDPHYSGDLTWDLPKLAVSFASGDGAEPVPGEPIHEDPSRRNLHGRTRLTCRLCGECNVGCNYGSKNTLDYTYLSEAKRLGAQLWTLCEVRGFSPRASGGYEVTYVQHELARECEEINTASLPLHTLTCDKLVISAGSLGSTFLLLKNKAALPKMSRALGSRFCGNGDIMGNVIRSHETRDGKRAPRLMDPSMGPVITTVMRLSDRVEGGKGGGLYLQDGGFPAFLAWLLEVSEAPGAMGALTRIGERFVKEYIGLHQKTNIAGELVDMLGPCQLSSTSFPVLGMGLDTPDGKLYLEDGHLDLDYTIKSSEAHYQRARRVIQDIAGALDGEYADNIPYYVSRMVTVHPLGGCPMGRDPSEGVVSPWGEVFGYPGLFVADGAVMPGPVGANPALTIAALADRFSDGILDPRRRSPMTSVTTSADTTVTFTEEMHGHVALGETADFHRGAEQGKKSGTDLLFHLTITASGVDRFIADPAHEATTEGYIQCDALGGKLPVTGGTFNLLVDNDGPGHKRMLYRLYFKDASGEPLTLTGLKEVKNDPGIDVWNDTTTLYTRILRGHVKAPEPQGVDIVASGILRLNLVDFIKQLTTFRATGATASERASALGSFGKLFLGQLWEVYGKHIPTASTG